MTKTGQQKIIFVVTEDWYFLSHRLPMARGAQSMGLDVIVATKATGQEKAIEAEGFLHVPLAIERAGLNPLSDWQLEKFLTDLYRRERPAIVHHVAMKPVIYGSRAARRAGIPGVVNALGGFGFLFVSNSLKARLLRPLVSAQLRQAFATPHSSLVLQNQSARDFAISKGLAEPDQITLIKGSGVDTDHFAPSAEPNGPVTCGFVARMLKSKGVEEIIGAAKILKAKGENIRFLMVGDADPSNPDSLSNDQMAAWQTEGLIDWRGRLADVAPIWAESHMALLPSWGEGLPKSLLEAASCGRPMITSNHTGCAELCRDGLDGLLIPDRDPQALADAIMALAKDPARRQQMGLSARQRIVDEFSNAVVSDQTKALYRALLEDQP